MKFAYADPPYIGQARKHYNHDSRCAEVDHSLLIRSLLAYDGWALSCSSPSLEEILHICRREVGINSVRVGGWFKPFASFKPGVNPGYTWEPVVFIPGTRKRTRTEPTIRDYVLADDVDAVRANITLKRGLAGAKPEPFNLWLFDLLGMTPADEFVDLFPGTGGATQAHEKWIAAQAVL